MDELLNSRLETIVELSDLMIEQTIKSMEIHGINDPYGIHILASSYTMTINRLDKVVPGFRDFMYKMIESRSGNQNEQC